MSAVTWRKASIGGDGTTARQTDSTEAHVCPVTDAIRVLGGKWSLPVLYHLLDGPRRFSDLVQAIPGITSKSLSACLSALEKSGLVARTVYPGKPVRIEYSTSPRGQALLPTFEALRAWSDDWVSPGKSAPDTIGRASVGRAGKARPAPSVRPLSPAHPRPRARS